MGKDDKGNSTACNAQTQSDAGGNFALTNLPAGCVGPQLIAERRIDRDVASRASTPA